MAEAVTLLRNQIVETQRRLADPASAGHRGALFTLGEITLELGLELTHNTGVNGGLHFSVVSLGGKKENARKSTHTLSMKLQPHLPGGGDIDVSDED